MKEDVREQRSHEQERRGAGIADADHARLMRPPKISRHNLQPSARRTVVVAGIEGNEQRRIRLLVHAQHEVLSDRRLRERNPLFGHASQDHSRIGGGVDVLKVGDAGGQLDVAVHRCVEQRLLGVEMPQDGGGGDLQLCSDIRQGCGREPLLREHVTRRLKDLLGMDERRAAHL